MITKGFCLWKPFPSSKIFYGSVDEIKFNDFVIEHLINVIGEYPHPNSIILMDNCSFHKNETFKWIINECGAILIYLPTYTPPRLHFLLLDMLERLK